MLYISGTQGFFTSLVYRKKVFMIRKLHPTYTHVYSSGKTKNQNHEKTLTP